MQEVYESLKEIIMEQEYADRVTQGPPIPWDVSLARGAKALEEFERENKKARRSGMILGCILFFVSVACIVGADYVANIWAEMMLLVGGVCLGGVAALIVVIAGAVTPRKGQNATPKTDDKDQHD